jgi:hypothetical protein
MKLPDVEVKKRLFVGVGDPSLVLGLGPTEIRGSAYVEGPEVVGDPKVFGAGPKATLMVGPNKNSDSPPNIVPGALCTGNNSPYSLGVIGNAAIFTHLDVNGNISAGNNIIAQGEVMSRCGGHILSAKKNFDIPHPTKEGWRLRHTCPEGPSNDVYVRGKTKKNIIELPEYWINLVDEESITVNLTPIGINQDLVVEDIKDNKIYIKNNGFPIHCFYHVYGERKDGEKLISEYEGSTPADYPGNNDEYSVSGYHYDIKEN